LSFTQANNDWNNDGVSFGAVFAHVRNSSFPILFKSLKTRQTVSKRYAFLTRSSALGRERAAFMGTLRNIERKISEVLAFFQKFF
jgi:hypothetical protein